jgi:very-short-patch-repair endonuclease
VSFSALITARSHATRNLFNRKIADFVICDRALQVVAVVELDDSSHKNKSEEDQQRDALLTAAGYRVIRYKSVPDIDRVRADFAPPAPQPAFQLEEITHG